MKKLIVLPLVCVIISAGAYAQQLSVGSPESVGLSPKRLENIDVLFNKFIDDGHLPGGVVLVARKGKIAYFKAFGNRNLGSKKSFAKDDIFRIASMTKAITTTAVLMLYEQGLFRLDDPISWYLPMFKEMEVLEYFNETDSAYTTVPADQEITIRHLLSHTSGISYGFMDPAINAIYTKNGANGFGLSHETLTTREMNQKIAQQPLLHQPGANWTYGHNTEVLGYFVEVISGKTLGEYCREMIFEPLGMTDTYFYIPKGKQKRLVPIYGVDDTNTLFKWDEKDANYPTYGRDDHFAGGGGLSSTAMDYAVFCQMLLSNGIYDGHRLLGRKTIVLMRTDQLAKFGIEPRSLLGSNGNSFGLGYALITEKSESNLPGSAGTYYWGGIYNTKFWINPDEDMFIVVMAQMLPFPRADLWSKLNTVIYSSIDD